MPDSSSSDAVMVELLERATLAVELAQAAGAADVRASAGTNRNVEYNLRDGVLEKVQEDTSRSVSLSLYVDGRFSSHSTSDLRPEPLKAFVAEAVAMTRVLAVDADRLLPDPSLYPTNPASIEGLVDERIPALDRDARLGVLRAMEAGLTGHADVISWTAGITDSDSRVATVTTNGFSGMYRSTSAWCGAEVTLSDPSGARPEDWFWGGGHGVADLPAGDEVARMCLALARARVGSGKGPTARTLMVVDPRVSGSLVRRLVGPASARDIHQGRSFWAGAVGKKLFSDKLTLADMPLMPGGLSSRPFDGEGIASRRLPLIEAGVVQNIFVDTYYGRKTGMAPTTGGSTNLAWTLGNRDLAAILKDVPDAIYVTSWLGGNADATTGDFSFGLRGHRVTNGVMGPPIGEMNVTGGLVQLFASLVEVGSDPYRYSSSYSPTLVFEGVQFSGA